MAITASLVKELRERTGAGMMECKKALVETSGDIDKAIEVMRKSGQAKADKKAGRVAAEGLIVILISDDAKRAVMLEVNCETDFVARDDNFIEFANHVAARALQEKVKDIDALVNIAYKDSGSVEEARKSLVAKVGENIKLRRLQYMTSDDAIGQYIHGARIGVLVSVSGGDEDLNKDVAMHIAASRPIVVAPEEVSQELLDKEKEIYSAQAQTSGKPADIIEKMVVGRLKKFVNEVSLLGQPFIKDPNKTVGALVAEHNAQVNEFVRFEVGEGIEKEETDFAREVMEQVSQS